MTALIVIGSILLFFVLIGLLRVTIQIVYRDDLQMRVTVCGIPVFKKPGKEKKPPDPKKYSARRLKKLLERDRKAEEAAAKKKAQKAEKKKAKKEEKKAKQAAQKAEEAAGTRKPKEKALSIPEIIELVCNLIAALFSRFFHHLQIRMTRVRISLATGDAANTAILYGVAVQSVAYLVEFLKKITNLPKLENADIDVQADFLGEKTQVDLCIAFSITVGQVFGCLFYTIWRAIKVFVRQKFRKLKKKLAD